MAVWYVWSAAAGAATGADWANAKLTLQAAITAGAAGDTYYVAHDHAETAAAATTITFKGTVNAIDTVLCVNRAGSVPPVSADLRATATITTTGANGLTLTGTGAYVFIYGVIFQSGSGAVTTALSVNIGWIYLKSCQLAKLGTTQSASAIIFAQATLSLPSHCVLDNTTVKLGATGDNLSVREYDFVWKNTPSALAGAIVPTTLFGSSNTNVANILCDGVDFSAAGSGKTLVGTLTGQQRYSFLNCQFGASVTVATTNVVRGAGTDVLGSDSSTANYRQERYRSEGTLTAETVVVPSSQQASDGTTALTWKVVTTVGANWIGPFETFAYAEWINTTGSPITRTFEIINDGTTLTSADVWAEAEYLGSSSAPLASVVSSGTADPLAAGSNLTTSTATWTTTGITTPVKQQIAVTFTPNMKGPVRIVFKIAKASKTLWINPRPNEV